MVETMRVAHLTRPTYTPASKYQNDPNRQAESPRHFQPMIVLALHYFASTVRSQSSSLYVVADSAN